MKLTDALTHLRSTLDQTYKFWGFYQAVTAAAVGFAWASSKPPQHLIFGLITAYAIFALFNCRLVVTTQSAALSIWKTIQNYKPLPEEVVNPTLLPITQMNRPDDPKLIGVMHVGLSTLAAFAMYARTWSL